MSKEEKFESAHQPAGGWGSVKAVTSILAQEKVMLQGSRVLMKQNKPDGFACVSCAWAKPAHPHPAEFCSNGAQATAWEITSKRVGPDFFQRHTATELEAWTDHALEEEGRLTVPLRWWVQGTMLVATLWLAVVVALPALAAAAVTAVLTLTAAGCGTDPTATDATSETSSSSSSSAGVAPDDTSLPPWPAPSDVPARVAAAGLDGDEIAALRASGALIEPRPD